MSNRHREEQQPNRETIIEKNQNLKRSNQTEEPIRMSNQTEKSI